MHDNEMDVRLPIYYILSRNFPADQVDSLAHVLSFQPIACVLISAVADAQLALKISGSVIRKNNEADALQAAKDIFSQTGHTSLVVGIANLLEAVYEDGTKEQVAHEA